MSSPLKTSQAPPPPAMGGANPRARFSMGSRNAAALATAVSNNTDTAFGKIPPPPMTTNALRSPQMSPQKGGMSPAMDKENASPSLGVKALPSPQQAVTYRVLGENRTINQNVSPAKQQAKHMLASRAQSNIMRGASPNPPTDEQECMMHGENDAARDEDDPNYSSKFFGKYLYLKSFRVKPQTPTSSEKKLRATMRPAHRRGLCVSPNALKEQMKVYHNGRAAPAKSVSTSPSTSPSRSQIGVFPSMQKAMAADSTSMSPSRSRSSARLEDHYEANNNSSVRRARCGASPTVGSDMVNPVRNLPDADAMTASPTSTISSVRSSQDRSGQSDFHIASAQQEEAISHETDEEFEEYEEHQEMHDDSRVARSLIADMSAASMSPSLKHKKTKSGASSAANSGIATPVEPTPVVPRTPKEEERPCPPPAPKQQARSLLDILGEAAALNTQMAGSAPPSAAASDVMEGSDTTAEFLDVEINDDDFLVEMEPGTPPPPPPQEKKKASPPRSPKPEAAGPLVVKSGSAKYTAEEPKEDTARTLRSHMFRKMSYNVSVPAGQQNNVRSEDPEEEDALDELSAAINRRAEKHFAAWRRMEKHYLDEYHYILMQAMITPFSRLEPMIPWEDARKLQYGRRTMLDCVMEQRSKNHMRVFNHHATFATMKQWLATLYLDTCITLFEEHIRFLVTLREEAAWLHIVERFAVGDLVPHLPEDHFIYAE